MLNPKRQKYVTASQCHRVMAGFEKELAGRKMQQPACNHYHEIEKIITAENRRPLVGEMKELGCSVTGKDISAVYEYVKATAPFFSDGMLSVALEIAMSEIIERRDEGITTRDMRKGNECELDAILALSGRVGVEFQCTGDEQIFLTRGNLGVTPDGIEFDDDYQVKSCGEVKNPKDTTHMKYLYLIRDQNDLLRVAPEYYWQAQCGLGVTGAEIYHWASHHSGFAEKYSLLYVPITPVAEHIEMLIYRADKVAEKVPEIVEIIKAMR